MARKEPLHHQIEEAKSSQGTSHLTYSAGEHLIVLLWAGPKAKLQMTRFNPVALRSTWKINLLVLLVVLAVLAAILS